MNYRMVMMMIVVSLYAMHAYGQEKPIGYWQTVDFVKNAEDFKPGVQSLKEDPFIKDFRCFEAGTTSLGWTWSDGKITHTDGKTSAEYYIKSMDGGTYLFLPWLSGDVTLRGRIPMYYVFRKVSDDPMTKGTSTIDQSSIEEIKPVTGVDEYADVRWKDMSALDLSGRAGLTASLNFNEKSVWPQADRMPPGLTPKELMAAAKNPGLGVRDLHGKEITGKGVRVAIIDQPLFPGHPEYAGKIAEYHDVGCGTETSMHGPAVASLLAGVNCGTAPDVTIYYVAAPSWTRDAAHQAMALDWIIDRNDSLPRSEKIRVVSVSAAPSGAGSLFVSNHNMWDEVCARAEAKGIMVLDCTAHHGFIGPCYYDASDPENIASCTPGFPGRSGRANPSKLLVPCSPRTTAEEYTRGDFTYQYCGQGGLSWSIPYCAGVLALGWQLRPDLTPKQMREMLFQSAHVTGDGAKIINPGAFIRLVKAGQI